MLRDVFLSRTSRPYGQPEKERSRKKKELVSDGKGGYDGMARRREKKRGNQERAHKDVRNEEEAVLEKPDSTVVLRTHGILSLADLHVRSSIIPFPSRQVLLCFLASLSLSHSLEILGGRLIQYNRVHFLAICMYRWLIPQNSICRRAFPPVRAPRLSVGPRRIQQGDLSLVLDNNSKLLDIHHSRSDSLSQTFPIFYRRVHVCFYK